MPPQDSGFFGGGGQISYPPFSSGSDASSFCPKYKESRRPFKCSADRGGKGLALQYVRAATSLLCNICLPWRLHMYTPRVQRGYCITEQHFVPNHCIWFVRQDKKEGKTSGRKNQNKHCHMISIQTHVLQFKNNLDWQNLGLYAAGLKLEEKLGSTGY